MVFQSLFNSKINSPLNSSGDSNNHSNHNNHKRKRGEKEDKSANYNKIQNHKKQGKFSRKANKITLSDLSEKDEDSSFIKNQSFERFSQRKPPSMEALNLSSELKDLSQKKQLHQALELYRNPKYAECRDGHHASIVVDCCSRCGAVEEGEKIIDQLRLSGTKVSVQARTALLKGYVLTGKMDKAFELFRSMLYSKDKYDRPNVRTFNTLLRGCLWNACSIIKSDQVVGGVVTSEIMWSNLAQKFANQNDFPIFDVSSYEYSVQLLCFALRPDEAMTRMNEMQILLGKAGMHDITEARCLSLVAIGRAYLLLGKIKKTNNILKEALNLITQSMSTAQGRNSHHPNSTQLKATTTGGKRAWRLENADGEDNRREESNDIFRNHRLSELKSEAESLSRIAETAATFMKSTSCSASEMRIKLATFMCKRLLYFSGGATTEKQTLPVKERTFDNTKIEEQLLRPLWYSFGLASLLKTVIVTTSKDFPSKYLKILYKSALPQLSSNGFMDFTSVFKQLRDNQKEDYDGLPLYIELGSGSGDWILNQAQQNPQANYISVELRADRVAQTFAKCAFLFLYDQNNSDTIQPHHRIVENVCCVGSECATFLRDLVAPDSITKIFVNHPEPPTQTYGANGTLPEALLESNEPAHMLNSNTIELAARCLKRNGQGQLIIVTDNKWYASLLCATIWKVMTANHDLLEQVHFDSSSGLHVNPESLHSNYNNEVVFYIGHPNESIGHFYGHDGGKGVSYFDRLWRAGAGRHADQNDRFIIALKTVIAQDNAKPTSFSNSQQSKKKYKKKSR